MEPFYIDTPDKHYFVIVDKIAEKEEGCLNIKGQFYKISIKGDEGLPSTIIDQIQQLSKEPTTFQKVFSIITQKSEKELETDPQFRSMIRRIEGLPYYPFDYGSLFAPGLNDLKEQNIQSLNEMGQKINSIQNEIKALQGSKWSEGQDVISKIVASAKNAIIDLQTQPLEKQLKSHSIEWIQQALKIHQLITVTTLEQEKKAIKSLQKILEMAICVEHVAFIHQLLGAGANVTDAHMFLGVLANSEKILKILMDAGGDPNAVSKDGNSLLEIACLRGEKASNAIKALIAAGSDLTAVNKKHPFISGDSPIYLAIQSDLPTDEVLDLLQKVDKLNIPEAKGTLLHAAIWRIWTEKDPKIFHYLIENGCNPNKPENGEYPLHIALNILRPQDLDKVVFGLLWAGHKTNVTDNLGRTPLHILAQRAYNIHDDAVIKMLLKAKAEIDTKDHIGQTPLHKAVIAGHDGTNLDMVSYLLDAHANINAVDDGGNTPLHLACLLGNVPAVKFLLEHGANRFIRNKDGNLPGNVAFILKDKEILDLLSKTV